MCAKRSDMTNSAPGSRSACWPARWAAIAFAGVAGGCSTDVSRFDFPVLGVTDSGGSQAAPSSRDRGYTGSPAYQRNETSPRSDLGAPGNGQGDASEAAPVGRSGSSVKVANLPEVAPAGTPYAAAGGGSQAAASTPLKPPAQALAPTKRDTPKREAMYQPAAATPATETAPGTGAARGSTIEVAQGDTLYKLSRKHKVSLAALMAANNLQNPTIKPGQKLIIPASAVVAQNRVPKRAEVAQKQASAMMAPTVSAGGEGYTVQAGESLYQIAKRLHVNAKDLAALNGITDAGKIRQGQVLKVPATAGGAKLAMAPAASANTAAQSAATPQSAAKPAAGPGSAQTAKVASLGKEVPSSVAPAAVEQGSTPGDEAPAKSGSGASAAKPAAKADAAGGGTGFRWPVKGKVIGKFGPKDDGSHNDGINIAVPAGTDVLAAQDGTVAYAGNELKGYGNLILIRHDDNWVSAYAHNDTILVKRGDKIKRGQAVAKAGKSGTVDQPQVHFELRQGSKPVDPVKHLAAN